jgi:hypothetical protein
MSKSAKSSSVNDNTEGVGGRQGENHSHAWGGGYQDVCKVFKFRQKPQAQNRHTPAPERDPRLNDLRAMGMPFYWQEIAEAIGVDAFLTMWRILDSQPQLAHENGGIRVIMRNYESYERMMRNRFVLNLHKEGVPDHEIRDRLMQAYGINLTAANAVMEIVDKFMERTWTL